MISALLFTVHVTGLLSKSIPISGSIVVQGKWVIITAPGSVLVLD
jgi:hypothetical protein